MAIPEQYRQGFPENYSPEAGAETQWCPVAIKECSAVGISGTFNRGGIGHIPQQTFDLTFSQSRINRALQFHKVGDVYSPDTGLNVSPPGYPTMSYEWVRDNIPEHPNTAPTSDEDSVALFGVAFVKGDDPTSRLLVIRANRSAVKTGMIDPRDPTERFNLYTITFLPFMRIYQSVEEDIYTESRLSNNGALTCDVFEGTQVRMECFDQRFITEDGEITDVNDNVVETSFFFGLSSWVQATLPNSGDTGRTWYALWCPEQESFAEYFGDGGPYGVGQNIYYGLNSVQGGYGFDGDGGTFDFRSDHIGIPTAPTMGVTSSGFYNIYKLTGQGVLADFGRALFPQLPWDEPVENTMQGIAKVINYLGQVNQSGKLLDYILDIHIIPCAVPYGSLQHITVGGREFYNEQGYPYQANVVDSPYVSQSCGSLAIPEAFGNFLDYTVRCKLYLPFYGYVEIPPEYWNGGWISVDYMFNVIDGSFVAYVSGRAKHSNMNALIGQYSGCAVTHIPLRGADYSAVVAGIITTGAGIAGSVGGLAVGNLGIAGAGASAVASGLGQLFSAKPNMVNNGSSNSSSAMMMYKTPYLIIEYPTPQFSDRYPKEKGLPLNVASSLGSYGGMTIATDVVLDGIPCTEREKERIRTALKSGLIFK